MVKSAIEIVLKRYFI